MKKIYNYRMIDLRLVLILLPSAACEHFGVPLLPLRAGSRVVLFSFGNQLVDRLKYKKVKNDKNLVIFLDSVLFLIKWLYKHDSIRNHARHSVRKKYARQKSGDFCRCEKVSFVGYNFCFKKSKRILHCLRIIYLPVKCICVGGWKIFPYFNAKRS